jgi:hypothetical protein
VDSWHIGAKPVERTEEVSLWDVAAEAEPKGGGLATVIRRAAHQHRRYHRCYERTLAWLGRWLVKWGWRLQERYGIATTH